jgi:hypothetical protein
MGRWGRVGEDEGAVDQRRGGRINRKRGEFCSA